MSDEHRPGAPRPSLLPAGTPQRGPQFTSRRARKSAENPVTPETLRNRQTDLVIAFLFAFIPLDSITLPGTSLPVNEVAAALVVVIAIFRRSRFSQPQLVPFALLAALFGVAILSSLAADIMPVRRLGSIAIVIGLFLAISGGRISVVSAGRGMLLGLTVGLVHGSAQLVAGASTYEGRLTGFVGDPNTAGLTFVTMGLCAIATMKNRAWRFYGIVVVLAGVGLTLSRTSLLALGIGLAWGLVLRRMHSLLGIAAVAGLIWLIESLRDVLQTIGPFNDRSGSDMLRERILEEEQYVVADSGLLGHGPGSATVDVDGMFFFFHSSYLALRAEIGWIGLILMLAAIFIVFFRMSFLPGKLRNYWIEASLIGLLTCALNLGEVFLAVPMAVTVGFGVWWANTAHQLQTDPAPRPQGLSSRFGLAE